MIRSNIFYIDGLCAVRPKKPSSCHGVQAEIKGATVTIEMIDEILRFFAFAGVFLIVLGLALTIAFLSMIAITGDSELYLNLIARYGTISASGVIIEIIVFILYNIID